MLKDVTCKDRLHQWARRKVVAILVFLNVVVPSHAAELNHVDVDNEEDIYNIRLEMQLDIAADYVNDVLTAFQRIECDAVSRRWVKMTGNEGASGRKEKSMSC